MLAALTIAEWPALKPTSHATLGRFELTAPSFPVAASRSIAISSGTCAELPFRLKNPAATNCLLTSVARLSCAQSELTSAMMYSTAACCVAQSRTRAHTLPTAPDTVLAKKRIKGDFPSQHLATSNPFGLR